MRPILFSTLLLTFSATGYAQSADIVRGRVVDDSSNALVSATVTITRGPDRLIQTTATDSAGNYSLRFEPGTGDYLVHIALTGFKSARRRVQRVSNERELVANFTLARDLTVLDPIVTTATRRVRASAGAVGETAVETGASEQWASQLTGAVLPGARGDLNAMAGTTAGVVMTGDGPSILGASPGSNLTTLNGMAMTGGSIPRAASTTMRVSGATFDPTRGGFSGANIDVRLERGNRNYQTRDIFLTLDAPALQLTDPIGRSMGLLNQGVRASGAMAGEAIRHFLVYNISGELSHSVSSPATLTSSDAELMRHSGLTPETAALVIANAAALGLPLAGNGAPDSRVADGVKFLGRFDDVRDSLRTLTLTTFLSADRQGALGYGPLAAPAAGGKSSSNSMGAQFLHSQFVGEGHYVLMQNRLGVSRNSSRLEPYSRIPAARVLVNSVTDSGTTDVASLMLGGNQGLSTDDAQWLVEASNEMVWMAGVRTHRFKSQAWFRADGLRQDATPNSLGSYRYSSLDDFIANRPTSYSRTIQQPVRNATSLNGALAIAHQWTPSRWFNMLYGARLEGNAFAVTPPANPELERALNVKTALAPARLHLSPRVGFNWSYDWGNNLRENTVFMMSSGLGSFSRPRLGFVRGGIGEFRDIYRPSMLADAVAGAGLPGSTLSLSCVGAAVPIPDWADINASAYLPPSSCTDGNGLLAVRAPAVVLLDRSFDAPRSWRATLGWESSIGWLQTRVDALGSYDLSQPGIVDANFNGTEQFTLAGEGNRPVFVSPAAIDESSGIISSGESRISEAFGRVAMRTSDLKGYGGQLTATIKPDILRSPRRFSLFGSLSYTLQRTVRQYRGFDGASFGDPARIEWATGANDVRHSFLLQGGAYIPRVGAVTLSSRIQSGMPFTPVVQGDIDGDGRGGDRAFIPAAGAADPALSAGLQSLLSTAPSNVRSCLESQRGTVAARNSCRGPWTQQLHVTWVPPVPPWIPNYRLRTSVVFENPLAGLDQLFNGAANMKGWGSPGVPDPVLLIPRGFDESRQQFRYDVNPRFGDTRPLRTVLRTPFRITLDFSLDLKTPYNVQQLRRALEPMKIDGRWEPRSADSIMAWYLQNNTSSIHRAILAESDSLFLTADQQEALIEADSVFAASVRSLYRELGRYLATQRDGTAGTAALDSAEATDSLYQRISWDQVDVFTEILTPQQISLIPTLRAMVSIPREDRINSRFMLGYPVTPAHTRARINR